MSMRDFLNIKTLILSFALIFLGASSNESLAQKFAYIDSDYVLLHMPDFAAAQQEFFDYINDSELAQLWVHGNL